MALQGTDLFVVQRQSGGAPLLKTTAAEINTYISKDLQGVLMVGNVATLGATFGSNTQVGGNPTGGVAEGVLLRKNGRVEAASNQGSTDIWAGYQVGTATATSTIKADGSITTAGYLVSQGNIYTDKIYTSTQSNSSALELGTRNAVGAESTKLTINADGSVDLTGPVTVGSGTVYTRIYDGSMLVSNEGTAGQAFGVYNTTAGDYTVKLNFDGSADFSGKVSANGGLEAYIPTNNVLSNSQRWFDDKYSTKGLVGQMAMGGSFWTKQAVAVGPDVNNPTATISGDGSATFFGNITKNKSSGSTSCVIGDTWLRIYDAPVSLDDYKISLNSDGSLEAVSIDGGTY